MRSDPSLIVGSFICALTVAVPVASWSAPGVRVSSEKQARLKTLALLRRSGVMQDLTCRAFLDRQLQSYGLPMIGRDRPVLGARGDINRRGENHSPPILSDSIYPKAGNYRSVTITSQTLPRQPFWEVKVDRTLKAKKSNQTEMLESLRYRFSIGSRRNQESCELEQIVISQGDEPESLLAADCLKTWDENSPAAETLDFSSTALSECTSYIGLFREVKNQMSDAPPATGQR